MGAFTHRHPQGMLSLPRVAQGSLYPMLRANVSRPSPQPGGSYGAGGRQSRAEPCCSPRPSPLRHRAALGTGGPQLRGGKGGFVNTTDAVPPANGRSSGAASVPALPAPPPPRLPPASTKLPRPGRVGARLRGAAPGPPQPSAVHRQHPSRSWRVPPPTNPASPYLGRRLAGGRAGRAPRSTAAPSSRAGPWLRRDGGGGQLPRLYNPGGCGAGPRCWPGTAASSGLRRRDPRSSAARGRAKMPG